MKVYKGSEIPKEETPIYMFADSKLNGERFKNCQTIGYYKSGEYVSFFEDEIENVHFYVYFEELVDEKKNDFPFSDKVKELSINQN